jgi:hypothetical protein
MPAHNPSSAAHPQDHAVSHGAAMRSTIRAMIAADGAIRCPTCHTLHCVDPQHRPTWAALVAAARRRRLYGWLVAHPTRDRTGGQPRCANVPPPDTA